MPENCLQLLLFMPFAMSGVNQTIGYVVRNTVNSKMKNLFCQFWKQSLIYDKQIFHLFFPMQLLNLELRNFTPGRLGAVGIHMSDSHIRLRLSPPDYNQYYRL